MKSEEPSGEPPEETLRALDAERRRRGYGSLILAAVIAILTVAVWFAFDAADNARDTAAAIRSASVDRDTRIDNLETALDAQRQQFEACRGEKANAPGCSEPVAPSPGQIGPQGIPGIQGIPGEQGPQGIPGLQGPPGPRGAKGEKGDKGDTGLQGAAGAAGAIGAIGPVGPKGDTGPVGPMGPVGPKGEAGPPGKDAPTIVSFAFSGGPTDCRLVVTLSDDQTYGTDVPGQFCVGN